MEKKNFKDLVKLLHAWCWRLFQRRLDSKPKLDLQLQWCDHLKMKSLEHPMDSFPMIFGFLLRLCRKIRKWCRLSRDHCCHSKIIYSGKNIEWLNGKSSYMNGWWTGAERKSWFVVIKVRCWVATEILHERIFQLLLIDMLGCTQNQGELRCLRQVKGLDRCWEHARFLTRVFKVLEEVEIWVRKW